MRLIDADDFKMQIAAAAIKNNMESVGLALCELVDAQPTACDLDKIIKQIGTITELVRPVGWSRRVEIVGAKDVIEIVKRGGAE